MSHNAYRKSRETMAGPRDTEYQAFATVTAALMAVDDSERDDLQPLAEAVHRNRLLWGMLANDCRDARNQLPEATRVAIIDLDRYVQQCSREIIRKRQSPQPLIDINRMIMDGLAGRAASPEAPAPA
ncbi:MAG: flagellar biosynthesis regulator FlaF [Pseudomonadota bacterium]